MKYFNNISIDSDIDLDVSAEVRRIMNERLSDLKQYTFSSNITEDDQYTKTHIAVLIPAEGFHVICVIDGFTPSNGLSTSIVGRIVFDEKNQKSVLICDFWFLENGQIYYEVIDFFIGQYGTEDPCPFDDLLVDNDLVSKILYQCVNFYLNRRSMYMKNNKRSEDYYLEMD